MPMANTVILIGNLTREPETKFVNQTPKCTFGLAMNRRWKGKDGAPREEVCFVECAAWGRVAEVVQQYCIKGKPLYVQGRLTLDQWTTDSGQKRSHLFVTVASVQLLGDKSNNEQQKKDPPF